MVVDESLAFVCRVLGPPQVVDVGRPGGDFRGKAGVRMLCLGEAEEQVA